MLKRLGKKYFSYWTLADWSIIICAFIAIFFYVSRYLLTNEILNTFKETKGNGYMKLQYVGVIDELYGYSIGLILFVATINFIRLLRFNNRFAMLLLTLKACWDDLTGFFSVFFLVFLAFVQVFYMILHSFMPEFHSITAALETCFTMLLNKFKFGSIRETSLTAAVMFFCFAISCSFILINVMLTIIMEAYEEVSRAFYFFSNLGWQKMRQNFKWNLELKKRTRRAYILWFRNLNHSIYLNDCQTLFFDLIWDLFVILKLVLRLQFN